jgi:rod shape-determining protein MreD
VIGSQGIRQLVFALSLFIALLLQLVSLPDFLAAARPMWLPLVIGYWALREPRVSCLVGAFVLGFCADIVFGTVIGQHALGLVVVAYLMMRLRPVFILFPLWQATLAMFMVWFLFALIMFWVDGISQHHADLWLRWAPVLSTTLFWPLIYTLLELVRGPDEDE